MHDLAPLIAHISLIHNYNKHNTGHYSVIVDYNTLAALTLISAHILGIYSAIVAPIRVIWLLSANHALIRNIVTHQRIIVC